MTDQQHTKSNVLASYSDIIDTFVFRNKCRSEFHNITVATQRNSAKNTNKQCTIDIIGSEKQPCLFPVYTFNEI